jgi:acetyl-CoA acyltransferase
MKEAFIVDGIRTPIGSFGGSLSSIRSDDLAAHVIRGLLERSPKINPAEIEEVLLGCANQAGEDNRNVARMALLLAGLPETVAGQTVNRLCASGLSAVVDAARALRLGEGELYIAGGVESMTRAPYVLSKSETPFSRSMELFDTSIGWRFVNPKMKEHYGTDSMGETAENVAAQYHISREDQDRFAVWSQAKALAAREKGRFESEILPVEIPQGKNQPPKHFSEDEYIRPGTTFETLSKLRPAFKKDGSVTAGNSSGINDGACALLLASEDAVKKFNLRPRAKIRSSAVVGVAPRVMGIGPVEATKKALSRAGLTLAQIEIIELNEAFAAQSLACVRELGLKDADPRINPNGGAIALGHPLGMSGARLVLSALHELEERRLTYALCTMCVGVGQGAAAIIERV